MWGFGPVNPIQEGAGWYGRSVAGPEGEIWARRMMGLSQFSIGMAGGMSGTNTGKAKFNFRNFKSWGGTAKGALKADYTAAKQALNNIYMKWIVRVPSKRTLASRLADKARSLPKGQRPNTVAVIKTRDGRIIVGRNRGSVVNNEVQGILDDIQPNEFGRQCAEVNTISRARNRGIDLTNAEISVSNVRGPNSTTGVHGSPKEPCTVCNPLIEKYNMKYVQ